MYAQYGGTSTIYIAGATTGGGARCNCEAYAGAAHSSDVERRQEVMHSDGKHCEAMKYQAPGPIAEGIGWERRCSSRPGKGFR